MNQEVTVKLQENNRRIKITGYNKNRVNQYEGELLEDAPEIKMTKGSRFLFTEDMIVNGGIENGN